MCTHSHRDNNKHCQKVLAFPNRTYRTACILNVLLLLFVSEIHHAGYKLPTFLYEGVEAMLIAFRKWTRKQDEFAKYHKLQIPIEMDAQKLIRNLTKELKMDAVRLLFRFPPVISGIT